MGLRILAGEGAGAAAIEGELSIYTVADLKAEFAALAAGELEIDLSGVTDIDTAGLQWLLMAKRRAGGGLRFVQHSAPVLALIELARLAGRLGDPLVLPHDSRLP